MCPALEKPNLHIDNACVFFIIFYYFFFHPKSVIIDSQIQNPQPQLSYQQQYTQNQHTAKSTQNHLMPKMEEPRLHHPRPRLVQKPQAEIGAKTPSRE